MLYYEKNKENNMIDNFDLEKIIYPLQEWFLQHARVLPWRENPKPYYVWISEIMLQQTRVEAVKPYFERFIGELPDVKSLSECSDEKLMKLWEGLGYYNRARNLKAAAIQIMEKHDGQIPAEYDELLKLKGIGHYTAGAISSIAFHHPQPAVDGNVLRVISRVTADDSDIMKQSVRTHMEDKLRELMQTHVSADKEGLQPSIFNQALMELGATVCLPNGEPHCKECPWKAFCLARREGRILEIPVKTKAKKRKIEHMTVLIVREGDRVAIHKRSSKGLLAGLYELPNCKGHLTPEEVLSYVKQIGYSPLRIQPLADAKHIFSHVEWHMKGYVVSVEESDAAMESKWLFVDANDVKDNYPIPAAFARYAEYMNISIGIDR